MTFDHLWSAALTVLTILGGAVLALLGRRIDRAEQAAQAARDAIAAHKTFAAETFSRKTELAEAFNKLERRFDQLDEKLDEKVDEIKDRLPPRRSG